MSKEKKTDNPQLTYWAFTWNSSDITPYSKEFKTKSLHGTIDNIVGFLRQCSEKLSWEWVFQMEHGEKSHILHLQGRLYLGEGKEKRKTKLSLLKMFQQQFDDIQMLEISPESNNSIRATGEQGLEFYVVKDHTRVPDTDPFYSPGYFQLIADKPRSKKYDGADLITEEMMWDWQRVFYNILKTPPDDRSFNVVWDPNGGNGKSKLQKFCRFKNMMKKIPMGSASQIKSSVITAGPWPAYCVNITRCVGSQDTLEDIFSALEELKDGWVQNAMYGKDAEMMLVPPHVFVFCNELPALTLGSMDRWVIWKLHEKTLTKLTPEEAMDLRDELEADKQCEAIIRKENKRNRLKERLEARGMGHLMPSRKRKRCESDGE